MTEHGTACAGVGLLGQGMLHDAIRTALGDRATTLTPAGPPDGVRLLLAVSDGWDTGNYVAVRRLAARRGIPWLPVRTELSHAVIGPLEVPRRAGCVDCAEARRMRNRADEREHKAVWRRHGERLAERPSSWLTGLGAQLVAMLVAEEFERLSGGAEPRTRGALLRIGLERLTITRHTFLADPMCPVCGDLPDDAPAHGEITLTSRPAHRPGTYRYRAIGDELETLIDTYVDEQTGLIRSLSEWSDGGFVLTAAPVGFRYGSRDAGYGRSSSLRASRLTALLEGLERYGSSPGARRTVVKATLRELGHHALDPRSLGLYPPERYELPRFGYQPFSPDRPYRWVWGWSFARESPILVPESCAYYGHRPHAEESPGFVYEISNGCALGGCLEEAILYGILEVAERDAFLLTWYARLPAARIDLTTARDRTVPLLAAAIQAETGYQVLTFDITVEQRIPCVWALARNPTSDGRPALACAAGSHPDPEQAIRNALAELGPSLSNLIRRYADEREAERARRMAADPQLVTTMEDHALLYADPEAASRLDFLRGGAPARRVAEVGGGDRGGFDSDDLRDNLLEAVARYRDHGMDVIVVNQTAAEHRAAGLSCVKVLIPGTLSMTFGHRYRRVDGLPRLYEVPRLLGYRDRALRPDEVNPHPHPFP